MQTESNDELIPQKPKLGDILWNKWPVFFQSVKIMKDKEKLKNCSRLKEKKLF